MDRWNDLYRAVDQHSQVIDVLVSTRRDAAAPHGISSPTRYDAARLRWRLSPTGRRFTHACSTNSRRRHDTSPTGAPTTWSKPTTADSRRGCVRCGLKRHRSVQTISAGHAFAQNLRRGHHAFTTDPPVRDRIRVVFDELALLL
jgi:IS6 family transposase